MKNELAFPELKKLTSTRHSFFAESEGGLTKRELFAAMAMMGLLADHERELDFKVDATLAVRMTDALIAELEKTK